METTLELLDAIPYVRAYDGQIFVIKTGGELIANPKWREGIARDLAVLHRLGIRVVWVHGGGPQLDAAVEKEGLDNERVAGRRVTSKAMIATAVRIWRGTVSTQCVSALANQGESAVGLSGLDGHLISAQKRPPALVLSDDGERVSVDYGFVGDVQAVSIGVLTAIHSTGSIPVISPLAMGENGQPLNVNADTIAAELAVALGAAKLLLLTRAPGILTDPNDPASVLHWTDLAQLRALGQEGTLTGGMRPKVDAIARCLEGGVPRVHVVDGRRAGALLEEVFTTEGSGTLVVSEANECPAEPLSKVSS